MADPITYNPSADPEEEKRNEESNALYYEARERGWVDGATNLQDDSYAKLSKQRRTELWNKGLRPTGKAWEAKYGSDDWNMMHDFVNYGSIREHRYSKNEKPREQWTKEENQEEERARKFHMQGGAEQAPIPYTDKYLSPGEKITKTVEYYKERGPESVDKGTASDLVHGYLSRIPVTGTILDGVLLHNVWKSSQRIEDKKATNDDYRTVGKYLAREEFDEQDPMHQKIFKNVTHLPAFAVEIYLSGGIAPAIKAGAKKGVQSLVKKGVKETVEQTVKKSAKEGVEQVAKKGLAARTGAALGKVGADSAIYAGTVGAPRTAGSALRESINVERTPEGYAVSPKNDWVLNLPEAYLRQMAEYAVEKGFLVPGSGGAGKIKNLSKLEGTGLFKNIQRGIANLDNKLSPTLRAAGVGNIGQEIMEERVNEIVQPLISMMFLDPEDAVQQTGMTGDLVTEALVQAGLRELSPQENASRHDRITEQGLTELIGLGLMTSGGKLTRLGNESDQRIIETKEFKQAVEKDKVEIQASTSEQIVESLDRIDGFAEFIDIARLKDKLENTEDPTEKGNIEDTIKRRQVQYFTQVRLGKERRESAKAELKARGVGQNNKGELVPDDELQLNADLAAGIETDVEQEVPQPEEGEFTLDQLQQMGQEGVQQPEVDTTAEQEVVEQTEEQPIETTEAEVSQLSEEEKEVKAQDPIERIEVDEDYANDLSDQIAEIEAKGDVTSRSAGKKLNNFFMGHGIDPKQFKSKEARKQFIEQAKEKIKLSKPIRDASKKQRQQEIQQAEQGQKEIDDLQAQMPDGLIDRDGRLLGKPRYGAGAHGNFELEWEDDVDKALYIVTSRSKNKRQEDYLKYLRVKFPDLTDSQILEAGKKLRKEVLAPMAKDNQLKGKLTVPKQAHNFTKPKAEAAPEVEAQETEIDHRGRKLDPKVEAQEPEAEVPTKPEPEKITLYDKEGNEREFEVIKRSSKGTPLIRGTDGQEMLLGHSKWSEVNPTGPDFEINSVPVSKYSDAELKVRLKRAREAQKETKVESYPEGQWPDSDTPYPAGSAHKRWVEEEAAVLAEMKRRKEGTTKPKPTETTKPKPTPKTKTPEKFQSQDYEAMGKKDLEKSIQKLGQQRDSMPEGPAQDAVQKELIKVAKVYNAKVKGDATKKPTPVPKTDAKEGAPEIKSKVKKDLTPDLPKTRKEATEQIKSLKEFIDSEMVEALKLPEDEMGDAIDKVMAQKKKLKELEAHRERLDSDERPNKVQKKERDPKKGDPVETVEKEPEVVVPEGLTKKGAYYYTREEGAPPVSLVKVNGKPTYVTSLVDSKGQKQWYVYDNAESQSAATGGRGAATRKKLVEQLEKKETEDIEQGERVKGQADRIEKESKEETDSLRKQEAEKEIKLMLKDDLGMTLSYNKKNKTYTITPIAAKKQKPNAQYEFKNAAARKRNSIQINEPLLEEGEHLLDAVHRWGKAVERLLQPRPDASKQTFDIKEQEEMVEWHTNNSQRVMAGVARKIYVDTLMKQGYSLDAAERAAEEIDSEELEKAARDAVTSANWEKIKSMGAIESQVVAIPDVMMEQMAEGRYGRTELQRIKRDPRHIDAASMNDAIDISGMGQVGASLVLEALYEARALHHLARSNNFEALMGETSSITPEKAKALEGKDVEKQRKVGQEHRQINTMFYDPMNRRLYSSDGQFVLQWEYDKSSVTGKVRIAPPVTGPTARRPVTFYESHVLQYTFEQIRATEWENIPVSTDQANFSGILVDDIKKAKEEYVRWLKHVLGKRMDESPNDIRRGLPWGVLNQEGLEDYFKDVIKAFKKERKQKFGTEFPPSEDMSMIDSGYLFSPVNRTSDGIKGRKKQLVLKAIKKIARGRKVTETPYGFKFAVRGGGEVHIAFRGKENLPVISRQQMEDYDKTEADKELGAGKNAGGIYYSPKNKDQTYGINELGMIVINSDEVDKWGGNEGVRIMLHELVHLAEFTGFISSDLRKDLKALAKKRGQKGADLESLTQLIDSEFYRRESQGVIKRVVQAFKDMINNFLDALGYSKKDVDYLYRQLTSGKLFEVDPSKRANRLRQPDSIMQSFGNTLAMSASRDTGVLPETVVRDKDGNPKLLLHGTPEQFVQFDKKKVGSNTGAIDTQQGGAFFFTDSESTAQFVGQHKKRRKAKVLKRYINLTNPLEYRAKEYGEGIDTRQMAALIKSAKAKGHDGIIYKTMDEDIGTTYVVFDNSNILIPTSRINEKTVGSKLVRPRKLNAEQYEIYEEAREKAEEIFDDEVQALEDELRTTMIDERLAEEESQEIERVLSIIEERVKDKEANKKEDIDFITNDILRNNRMMGETVKSDLDNLEKKPPITLKNFVERVKEIESLKGIMLNEIDLPDNVTKDTDLTNAVRRLIRKKQMESRSFTPDDSMVFSPQSIKTPHKPDRPSEEESNLEYDRQRAHVHDRELKRMAATAVAEDLEGAYKIAVGIMRNDRDVPVTVNNLFLLPAVQVELQRVARISGDADDIVKMERYRKLHQEFGSILSAAFRSRRDPLRTQGEEFADVIEQIIDQITEDELLVLEKGTKYDTSKDSPSTEFEIELDIEPAVDDRGKLATPLPEVNDDTIVVDKSKTGGGEGEAGGTGTDDGTGTGRGTGDGTGKGTGEGTGSGTSGKRKPKGKKDNTPEVQKVLEEIAKRRADLLKYLKSRGYGTSRENLIRIGENPELADRMFYDIDLWMMSLPQKTYSWFKAIIYGNLLGAPETLMTNLSSALGIPKIMRLEKKLGRKLFFELPEKLGYKGKIEKSTTSKDMKKFDEVLRNNPELADAVNVGMRYSFVQGMNDSDSIQGKLVGGFTNLIRSYIKDKKISWETAVKTMASGVDQVNLQVKGFDASNANFWLQEQGVGEERTKMQKGWSQGSRARARKPHLENELLLALRADDAALFLQKLILAPTNLMMATDNFFKMELARSNVGIVAAGMARRQVEDGKLEEGEVEEFIINMVSDKRSIAWQKAVEFAQVGLFQKGKHTTLSLGKDKDAAGKRVVTTLNSWARKNMIADAAVLLYAPFKMTPINIFVESFNRSPVSGWGFLIVHALINRAEGRHPFDGIEGAAFTNAVLSLAMVSLSLMFMSDDDDDDDDKPVKNTIAGVSGERHQRQEQRELGYLSPEGEPGTVTIGGVTWGTRNFAPYAGPLHAGAEGAITAKEGKGLSDIVGNSATATINSILDLPLMESPKKLEQFIRSDDKWEGLKELGAGPASMATHGLYKSIRRETRPFVSRSRGDDPLETWKKRTELAGDRQPIVQPFGIIARNEFIEGDATGEMDILGTLANMFVPLADYKGKAEGYKGAEIYKNWNKKVDQGRVKTEEGEDKPARQYPNKILQGPDKRSYREDGKTTTLTRPEFTEFSLVAGAIAKKYVDAHLTTMTMENPSEFDIKVMERVQTKAQEYVKDHHIRYGNLKGIRIDSAYNKIKYDMQKYILGNKDGTQKEKARWYNGRNN